MKEITFEVGGLAQPGPSNLDDVICDVQMFYSVPILVMYKHKVKVYMISYYSLTLLLLLFCFYDNFKLQKLFSIQRKFCHFSVVGSIGS